MPFPSTTAFRQVYQFHEIKAPGAGDFTPVSSNAGCPLHETNLDTMCVAVLLSLLSATAL